MLTHVRVQISIPAELEYVRHNTDNINGQT